MQKKFLFRLINFYYIKIFIYKKTYYILIKLVNTVSNLWKIKKKHNKKFKIPNK